MTGNEIFTERRSDGSHLHIEQLVKFYSEIVGVSEHALYCKLSRDFSDLRAWQRTELSYELSYQVRRVSP